MESQVPRHSIMDRQSNALGLGYDTDVIERFFVGYTLEVYMEDSTLHVQTQECVLAHYR